MREGGRERERESGVPVCVFFPTFFVFIIIQKICFYEIKNSTDQQQVYSSAWKNTVVQSNRNKLKTE